jgi:hypothetical protein
MHSIFRFLIVFIMSVMIGGALIPGCETGDSGSSTGNSSSNTTVLANNNTTVRANNNTTVPANNNSRNCVPEPSYGKPCNTNGGPECCETGRSCFRANPDSTAGVCM